MDIFGTAVTATGIIYNFLVACSAFSSDAKSLAARFQWDLVALESIRNYFQKLHSQDGNKGLSQEHAELLRRTAEYLDDFANDVQKSLRKIEREGWLQSKVNLLLWETRHKDLEKMQAELQYWTDRFGVRVLALPDEIRNVIQPAAQSPSAPPVVQSNLRLLEFTRLTSEQDRKQQAREMLQDSAEMSSKIEEWGDISFIPLQDGDKQVIFATRNLPESATPDGTGPGKKTFDKIESDVCLLAAALHCLNPSADVRLLQVESCFYHAISHQFLLEQTTPYPTVSMMTLGQMISKSAFPLTSAALGDRLRLAHKLAEAVVFLHAAGFLHKNISSSSAVALRRARQRGVRTTSIGPRIKSLPGTPRPSPTLSTPLDEVYLMGFDLVRGIESRTSKEGAESVPRHTFATGEGSNGETPASSIWERLVYMHPERLKGVDSQKYQKVHDVYSLGVVLLEVGLWEPLSAVAAKRGLMKPDTEVGEWPTQLRGLAAGAAGLASRVGKRYYGVVEWCLDLTGDDGIEQMEFVQNVLDPLEEMARAVS